LRAALSRQIGRLATNRLSGGPRNRLWTGAILRHGSAAAGSAPRKEAAHALRLSFSAYREKLRGASPVDERTELLCAFHEVFLDLFVGHALRQAEASVKLAEQLSAPLAAAAQRALDVLNKLAKMGDGAPKVEEALTSPGRRFA
jgi:hypothetical protein